MLKKRISKAMSLYVGDRCIGVVMVEPTMKKSKQILFTIRKWYSSPNEKTSLYDLFNDSTSFKLIDKVSSIFGCLIYRWKPIMGKTNDDIIGEEATGVGAFPIPIIFTFEGKVILNTTRKVRLNRRNA